MKKKLILTAALLLAFAGGVAGQTAKKPTIMVVPSENGCKQNGFTMTFDNQGVKETLPD